MKYQYYQNHQKRSLLRLLPLSLLAVGLPLAGQQAPIIRTGVFEVGGFLGASYGIDKARVMGGGNIVYSVTRALLPYAEVSYFPGIGRSVPVLGLPGGRASFSIPITDFNFGLHLRAPIPNSRVIPYAVIGFGGLHSSARTERFQVPDPFVPGRTNTVLLENPASTSYATSFGAGLRLYATESLGFRGEVKGYKPTGDFSDVFYRVTGGIFIQF